MQEISYRPIKIHIFTEYLEKELNDLINPDPYYRDQIIWSINKAKETLESLISVRNESKTIRLANYGYGLIKNISGYRSSERIVSDFYQKSIECDLIILIRKRDESEKIIDFAYPEILESDTDFRPRVGSVVYRYDFLNIDDRPNLSEEAKKNILSIMFLHEFTHILGFNFTILFKKNMLTLNTSKRIDGKSMSKYYVKSEKVLSIAKKYFNCSGITGVELDNQTNSEGLTNYHWEGRLLLGDYMTSEVYYPEQAISEITLALLEDLTWYKVKYYTGGLMRFGKNKGCSFITNDCFKPLSRTQLKSSFPNEFCSDTYSSVCSSGRQSRGVCYILNNKIDSNEKIYNRQGYLSTYGKENVEFCPVVLETKRSNTRYYNGSCKNGDNTFGDEIVFKNDYGNYNKFLEEFGNFSFCALSSILEKEENDENYVGVIRPTCYKMFCSNKSLTIQIKTEYVVCPREGGILKIGGIYSNYLGHLYCPDYYLICTGTTLCNDIFDCIEKKSLYKDTSFNFSDYSNNEIPAEVIVNSEPIEDSQTVIGFEQSMDGICPIYCRQCIENSKCIICSDSHPLYVGTKENDNNPINCYNNDPGYGYYNFNEDGKTFYFKCIDNCRLCQRISKDYCDQCFPTHFFKNRKCEEERIPGCEIYDESSIFTDPNNNNGPAYSKCYNCNNSAGYYCIEEDRTVCHNLTNIYTNDTYFVVDPIYKCVKKCDRQYDNCEKCDNTHCTKCKEGFKFNNNNYCVEIIKNCQDQNLQVNYAECTTCNKSYYCIDGNKASCNQIDNIIYYYNMSNSNNCIKRCNNTFPNCEECDNDITCKKCKEGYFFYARNKSCIQNITGCINNYYDGIIKECNECNMNKGYYCLNESKAVCHKMETTVVPYYYQIPEINYPCYQICDSLVKNCLKCNQTICHECTKRYIINYNGTYCFVKPFDVPDDDKCLIKYITYNKSIYEIDPWDFADYYWDNIPYISTVDHYIGENYTITVFTNSECTEDLLNNGYYKIDSKELQNKMIKEAGIEGMKIIFSVFINYNHKNHFRYHDLETKFLNPNKYCQPCLEIDYNITNKFYNPLKDALGLVVANLITSEKIEFAERDSDIYNDICKNITIFGIDLPLKQRLKYLYLHNYTEQILCNSENCTLEECDYENLTTKCKCKIGNDFKDILKGENFLFIPYEGQPIDLNNDFIDSLEIIKCALNGFKSKNVKANIGFFISIIAIVSQIILFVYYCLFSKSIVNINKNVNANISNPPKNKNNNGLMMISDWERITRDNNKISDENEVYVQSRDDAEDQLLEEEKSYSKDGDIFDASSLSIDTNVGGAIRNISTGNKKNIKEKADNKRVLILLSNKGKNKSKNLQEDLISDSDIIPLEDSKKVEIKNFLKIYWYVLSLKQHIINYFSNINCCKITESYIPISIRLIRSIFMIILTFVLNILWLNQTYYLNKFEYFNNEYKFIYTQVENKVPTGKRFSYAFSNTFVKGLITFAILLVVQFLIGFIFFSVRNNVIKAKIKKNNDDEIEDVVSCSLKKYLLFFIINMTLMIIFLFSLTGFCGAYGGGFVDYFVASIISLIFLEIFPFLWSIVIALFIYFGYKKNIKWLKKISHFLMF